MRQAGLRSVRGSPHCEALIHFTYTLSRETQGPNRDIIDDNAVRDEQR